MNRIKRTVVTLFLLLSLVLASGAMAGRTTGGDSFPGGSDQGDGGTPTTQGVPTATAITGDNTNQQAQGQLQGQLQLQGQAQGQGQGQAILIDEGALSLTGATNNNASGAASNSSATGGQASANNSIVFEGAQRDFHVPLGAPVYGAGDVRWGPKDKAQVRGYISRSTLVKLVGTVDVMDYVRDSKIAYRVESFSKGLTNQPHIVKLSLERPEGQLMAIGSAYAAKGEGRTSAKLVKDAAKYCSAVGAGNIVLLSQTVSNEMYSSGWGIGLGYNAAGMSNGGDLSQIGSGGTGYSSAKGGHSYRLGLEFACVE